MTSTKTYLNQVHLEPLAPDLWTLAQPLEFMKTQVGTRTTVVRLPDGKLWIHSPGPQLPGVYHELKALGDVAYLIAPNPLHHMFLPRALQMFPDAVIYAPRAVQKKHPRLPMALFQPGKASPWPWLEHVGALPLQGLRIEEWVFFHKASQTLMLTDLLFNMQAEDWPTRLMLHAEGVYNKLGCTRLVAHVLLNNRTALRKSCERILTWDFARMLMCHGTPVDNDARAKFVEAMAFTGITQESLS